LGVILTRQSGDPHHFTGGTQTFNTNDEGIRLNGVTPSEISPNFQAGTIGRLLWLHHPKWINTDMAVSKVIPLYKELTFKVQGELLNVFNHPAWAGMDTGVQDKTFGTTSNTANGPRNIELRANFQF
jgi:hypothetical protein